MKKLINTYKKVRNFIKRKPKMVIPVVAILCIFIFMIAECARAAIYLNSVNDYKKSAKVLVLQDSVVKLQNAVDAVSSSYFCDIDLTKLTESSNEAKTEVIVEEIRNQIEQVKPAPAFSSLVDFLPRPKKARATSVDLKKSTDQISNLVQQNVRSAYCLELDSALTNINFLQDLQKPQGVSALLPGQIESYQTNTAQSKEVLLAMKFPTEFEQDHIKLLEIINKIEVDLRGNDNNYKQFSRAVESDVNEIDAVLASIRLKTVELQEIPQQIDIAASVLE